ncbi:CBS domain-containing protein [archaeon]|nr:CBS domain-containing protein [archaeon]
MGVRDYSTSLKEWRVLPSLTKKGLKPLLKTSLTNNVTLKTPLISAAMQAVTATELAIELAKMGGLGVIHCNQSIEEQARMIKGVKKYRAGFVESPLTVKPDTSLKELLRLYDNHGFSVYPITNNGEPNGKYLGVAFSEDFRMSQDYDLTATDFSIDIKTHEGGLSLNDAKNKLRHLRQKCLPILSKGRLDKVVFRKDVLDERRYPSQLRDRHERLMVAAAINTHDYEQRAPALIKAGADLLVIDSSQGYSDYQAEAIEFVKKQGVSVVGGNVITREGFKFLVEAGADAVKVGMGGGSICITQEVKRIGRGQATAVRECAAVRREMGVNTSIISDGGIVSDGDIFIALALGADAVMMGRYFARFEESPTKVIELKGKPVKPYWGEGSRRAMNNFRYESFNPEDAVVEGVEGHVPYAGRLEEGVRKTVKTLTNAMKTAGAYTIKDLHELKKEYVSLGSRAEGDVHDIIV